MRPRLLQLLVFLCLSGGAAAQGVPFPSHGGLDASVRGWIQNGLLDNGSPAAPDLGTIGRLVPGGVHIGLGLTGVQSRLSFGDRLLESAMAHAFCTGLTYLGKWIFYSPRPDGSSFDSFPSGHVSIAFTGAELMRMDYGWGWGAGGYLVAGYIGAERLWGDRHYLSDVLCGAGIGILSAHVGLWLLGPVKRLLSLPEWTWDGLGRHGSRLALAPSSDPLSGTPTVSLALSF